VDPDTQAISARMLEDKIRNEWIRMAGTADCNVIVDYDKRTEHWKARPASDDLAISERRVFVTAVNRVLLLHKVIIKVQLPPR